MQPQIAQPSIAEYESSIKDTRDKIKLLKASLTKDEQNETRKNDRSATLSAEYQKINQLRSDQCDSLKELWETYRSEQTQYRKRDAGKRQTEFDEELKKLDAERRRKWKVESEPITNRKKKEMYDALLTSLRNCETDPQFSQKAPIFTLPVEILEIFWSLDIQVPITKSEISDTIQLVEDQIKNTSWEMSK